MCEYWQSCSVHFLRVVVYIQLVSVTSPYLDTEFMSISCSIESLKRNTFLLFETCYAKCRQIYLSKMEILPMSLGLPDIPAARL